MPRFVAVVPFVAFALAACAVEVPFEEPSAPPSTAAALTESGVVFSPQPLEDSHLPKIAELIEGAQHSVDVAMYSYSDARINAALAGAAARGVKVRFLSEAASDDRRLSGAALTSSKSGQLEAKGIDVRWVNKILHHKFVLVDGPRDDLARADTARLATGSANWSNGAATRFDENTLFLVGAPELALRFQREFELLWTHSRDFASRAFPEDHGAAVIGDPVAPDDPAADALFTSANFDAAGDTFRTNNKDTVSEAMVAAIRGARASIHIASGHLRSRPISEALMARAAEPDAVDIKVYLDGQEFISAGTHRAQEQKVASCLVAAGTSAARKRDCLQRGFLFGYQVGRTAGIDVRYKYYAYRWDYSYAPQMHHKYMVVDGETLFTGSYNFSDNAERDTFENVVVLRAPAHAAIIDAFEANFTSIWETGRGATDKLPPLRASIASLATIPIVFEPMALTWSEVSDLKDAIRERCPAVDGAQFRENAARFQSCTPPR